MSFSTVDATAKPGAGVVIPAPAPAWIDVERVTATYHAGQEAKAAEFLNTPDADLVAVDTTTRAPALAVIARFVRHHEEIVHNSDLLPEAKSRQLGEVDEARRHALAALAAEQRALCDAAEARVKTFTPRPRAPDPADAPLVSRVMQARDTLGPAEFVPMVAEVLRDPANFRAVRQMLPALRDAYNNPASRLYGDPDMHRLLQLAARLEVETGHLHVEGRLQQIAQRRAALDQLERDAAYALRAQVTRGPDREPEPLFA
jgi:hypothetical protein